MLGLFDKYFLKDHSMRDKKMPVGKQKVIRPEKYEVAKATMQNPLILSKCKYAYSNSITKISSSHMIYSYCVVYRWKASLLFFATILHHVVILCSIRE